MPHHRRWPLRLALLALAGAGGYLSRGRWQHLLPLLVRKRAGDAFWAAAVFSLLGLCRPRWSTARAAAVALGVCYAIEFSQICQAEWIDRVRATLFGRLVLGSAFFWLDQVAYTVGITAWAGIETAGDRLLWRPADPSDR